MNKILAMMNNRRSNHRYNDNKTSYLLILLIFVLLYTMNHLYDDNKSLSVDKEILEYELNESDSIKQILEYKNILLYKKLDSIKSIKTITKPLYKRRKDIPIVTPVTVIADTTN